MRRLFIFVLLLVTTASLTGVAAVLTAHAPAKPGVINPVWAEIRWPFQIDQWGTGRAFVCAAADCGAEVSVYVRPKIGYCNCSTGVSDDTELERVSDTELVSRNVSALGRGRPIKVGWMVGLSRAYRAPDAHGDVLSVAFNDQCDVVVAVANLGDADPDVIGPAVLTFLNTNPMVLWAKKELGLEFIRREW